MAFVKIRQQARFDLLNLWIYVAEQSGDDEIADAFLKKVRKTIDLLSTQPRMGRTRDELKPGLRSFAVGRYLIFYYPLKGGVDVVRVVFGGRNLDVLSWYDEDDLS